jgi:uncharacterized SAM-binding protein YcdF (DUF218 family)
MSMIPQIAKQATQRTSQIRLLYRLGLLFAGLWLLLLVIVLAYGKLARAKPADVLVVLGAQVKPNGSLGPALTRRTQHAFWLWQHGYAADIICTGGVGVRSPISEAAAACNQLAAWGVPDAHLWLEPTARSTEESAVFVSAMARRQGWQTLLVVTDDYHVLRSQLLFWQVGMATLPAPAQQSVSDQSPNWLWYTNREVAALFWYLGKGLLISAADVWQR